MVNRPGLTLRFPWTDGKTETPEHTQIPEALGAFVTALCEYLGVDRSQIHVDNHPTFPRAYIIRCETCRDRWSHGIYQVIDAHELTEPDGWYLEARSSRTLSAYPVGLSR